MANLSDLNLLDTMRGSSRMIACARVLLDHLESVGSLPYRQSYWHFADFLIGELEKCVTAAPKLQILALASGTRNLFEVSLVVEYACTSDQNMDRFVIDALIDELEIMHKLLAIEQRKENYHRDAKSQQREQNLRAQIADAGLIGKGPLQAFEISAAIGREHEYRDFYKVFSKMSHATAWAILGTCSWDSMALFLLTKANSYAAESLKHLAKRIGLPESTPVPSV